MIPTGKGINLNLPDSEILYFSDFLEPAQATGYFEMLRHTVPWSQDPITLFGKTYMQPRLTALYGNNGKSYTYSGITMHPQPFFPELSELKDKVETISKTVFTSCLLNLYRDGKDSNGWHADDEKELGPQPVIASLSLGQPRSFHLKHREKTHLKHRMELAHGSLLLMQGSTQRCWLHQVPKTSRPVGERINLTFRQVGL